MDIVILAGGFGTRLSHIVSDVPKPMAPLCGRPFLYYLLKYIARYSVKRIILATGYKADAISSYFGNEFHGIPIVYSVESEPLGTGGAIKKAFDKYELGTSIVINGDTFCSVNLSSLFSKHINTGAGITMTVRQLRDCDRYGAVVSNSDGRVIGFIEKKSMDEANINTGVYVVNISVLEHIQQKSFSFERDILEKMLSSLDIRIFQTDAYFIDIGVPEDYVRAQEDCKFW